MGKGKGGGGGGGGGNHAADDARRRAEEARRKADEDARRRADDDAKRKAQEAKLKAQTAQQKTQQSQSSSQGGSIKQAVAQAGNTLNKGDIKDLKQQGYSGSQIQKVAGKVNQVGQGAQPLLNRISSNQGGNGTQPTVKAGLETVGKKLSQGEAKDLKQDGYSIKQIGKIADQVKAVKPGAEQKISNWQEKATAAKEKATAVHHSSGSQAIRDLLGSSAAGGGVPAPPAPPAPAVPSTGQSYGTADRDGWLNAELNAIDTYEPDLEATVFNNYRPTGLSGQLRDAVDEANQFIDSTSSSWGSSSSPSVRPSTLRPRSLLEEEEQERYGVSFGL
jgi:hypothetical protein